MINRKEYSQDKEKTNEIISLMVNNTHIDYITPGPLIVSLCISWQENNNNQR